MLNAILTAVVTTAFKYLTNFLIFAYDYIVTNAKIKRAIENARKTGDTTDLEIIINE